MNLIKKTKLKKKNKPTTTTTSHTIHTSLNNNSLSLPKLVSRKKLNKLILKGGKYVRNYNVSSVHSKKTQSKNGSLKRTLTALKNKNYFTKSQKQDGGFIIDAIRLKYKLSKFKSFLKKYRKEEKEVQKYIDSYTGKGNILEMLKDSKYNKTREYIIHYRKLKIFEFLKNNKDNEKDIKTIDIDEKFTDAESKIKGIGKSLKQFETEQKKEIPNLKKQTKTFKTNSKEISKLIAYFEKNLRKYYEEIKLIRERYKQFQGKSKLDSEAKSDIKKYQRFAKDIDFILSFTDMEQKKMIDLKNNIATILDKGQTFSTQFKDFDSSKFGEDLEKWKENYTRIYENLDITSDIDDIVEIYTVTINNFEIIKNQLIIIKMSKVGDDKNIALMTDYISKLKSNKDDILEKVKKYILQLKIALVIEKPFKDVDTSITLITGAILNSIKYNKQVLTGINTFNNSVSTTGVSQGGSWRVSWSESWGNEDDSFSKGVGGASKPIDKAKYFSYNILYSNLFNLDYKALQERFDDNKYKLDEITNVKIKYDKKKEPLNFFDATIEQQYNTLKDLFTIWLYLTYWSEGAEQKNNGDTVVDIFTQDQNKVSLLTFIKLIFVYELLCYNDIIKNNTLNTYVNLKDVLITLFNGFNPFINISNILSQMKQGSTTDTTILNLIKTKNTTVDKWIVALKDKTEKMNNYQLSDISIKSSTQKLILKSILEKEFIVTFMNDEDTKKKFNEEYKDQVTSLQTEINDWIKPDNNPFKKAIALSILYIRLQDKHTPEQKQKIDEYIKQINDDITIDINQICDDPSASASASGPGPASTLGAPGPASASGSSASASASALASALASASALALASASGTLGTGSGVQGKAVPDTVQAKGIVLVLPKASGPANTLGMLNLPLNLTNDVSVSNNFNIIIESSSELATTLEKLTPSDNDTSKLPEPYDKIIKKLTIINECVSNLKLIEPKFKLENAKYAKVDLDYNWAQDYFKKETEFGVTSDISTIKATSNKTTYQSPPDKTKKDFSESDFNKLLRNPDKQTDDFKSIFDNLKSSANVDIFKKLFETISNDLKCSVGRKLATNHALESSGIRAFIAEQISLNCIKPTKPQGSGY
jgi:hypothetical protein